MNKMDIVTKIFCSLTPRAFGLHADLDESICSLFFICK